MKQDHLRQLQDLYRSDYRGLFIYALSITRQKTSAEDSVQEALIAVAALKKQPDNLKAYLYRVVRNKALHLHTQRLRQHDGDRSEEELIDTDASPAELQVLARQVNRFIDLLEVNYRQILVMKLYADLTFEEIAAITDYPLNTVASWYRRGLIQLRELIHGSGKQSGKIARIS